MLRGRGRTVLGRCATSSRPARIALGGMVLLGVATICDALLPLSCTPTADTACAAREAAGLVPLTHAGHAFSSGAAGFGGVVAVVGWILWRRGTRGPNPPGAGSGASGPNRTRPGFDSALAALAAGIAYLAATGWTLAAMVEPALYLGLAQRLQILALTVWLALVALRPLPGRRR
nr:DUF998 domain-containing protein [Tsukamurella sp. PLM1]